MKNEIWFRDAQIGLRPGALQQNVALLTAFLKGAAKAGVAKVILPEDAVSGGDCGSLGAHPAFVAARAAAERKFLSAAARIKRCPEIAFGGAAEAGAVSLLPQTLSGAGDDPAHPFCGRPAEVFACQTIGLAGRLAATGCRRAVIGLSGGLDSALALLVTVAAFDALGLARTGVRVFTMPGFGTTKRTRGNADRLAEGLGLRLETIDITPACRLHFKDIAQPETRRDITFENAQARERTQILMDKANQIGGMVIGTGDMSEIALGWCTYNGDHMSMFGVNAGVPKTTVRDVCRWWAEERVKGERLAAEALKDILETPVSPELLPPDKAGKIAQKTEDRVGPYELHDFFLWHFVAEKKGRAEILRAAVRAFKGVYGRAEIAKWLDVFFTRLFAQAFKRNCAPDGVKVFEVYFSPQDWHVPSDVSGEAFAK